MFTQIERRVARSIAGFALLCTGCGVGGEPVNAVAPEVAPASAVAELHGEASVDGASARVELPGESVECAALDVEHGRLDVRIDTPADLPLEAWVAVVEREPREFLRYFADPRLLDDELATDC